MFGYTLLAIVVLGYLFLSLRHSFAFSGGPIVWSSMLFLNQQFYSLFKYVPLAGGAVLAFSQYVPEVQSKRIKLTFHLPLGENKSLVIMQGFGTLCLALSFFIQFGLFVVFSLIYFPVQMVSDSVITVLPWFLAGFSTYFIIALVIPEPLWVFRFFYSVIGGLFLMVYFESATTAAYTRLNPFLAGITVMLGVVILFSAYRFRKGEM